MSDERGIKEAVRERYGRLAAEGDTCRRPQGNSRGTGRACGLSYSPEELASLDPAVVSVGLGCGNPTGLAELGSGEVVLDLGSGGGIDVFLAAKQVGPSGKAIGIDMTEEMLERARRAAAAMGINNVEFRQGDIEALPIQEESVDVVISNCVINLAPDKSRVFREAFRVLKTGGRMVISDVVSNGPLSPSIRTDPQAWAGCIGGALEEREYLDLIRAAGFQEIEVLSRQRAAPGEVYSISVRAHKAGPHASSEHRGIADGASLLSPRDRALIAVGAARAACSEAVLRSSVEEARGLGWTEEAIRSAIELADCIKEIRTSLSN